MGKILVFTYNIWNIVVQICFKHLKSYSLAELWPNKIFANKMNMSIFANLIMGTLFSAINQY